MGNPADPLWTAAEAPILPTSGVPIGPAARETIQYVHEETRYQLSRFPGGYKTPGMPPRPGYLEGVMDTIQWARLFGRQPQLAGLPPLDQPVSPDSTQRTFVADVRWRPAVVAAGAVSGGVGDGSGGES